MKGSRFIFMSSIPDLVMRQTTEETRSRKKQLSSVTTFSTVPQTDVKQ